MDPETTVDDVRNVGIRDNKVAAVMSAAIVGGSPFGQHLALRDGVTRRPGGKFTMWSPQLYRGGLVVQHMTAQTLNEPPAALKLIDNARAEGIQGRRLRGRLGRAFRAGRSC